MLTVSNDVYGPRSGTTFMTIQLKDRWGSTVVAFRGYNVGNRGRSAELLRHPQYGPVVKNLLREASEICSQASGQKTDLIRRVRSGSKTRLGNFAQDIAIIVSMELAQIRLLEQFHGVDYGSAKMAFGYSLGELTSLICGGACRMEDVLPPLLSLADDCADLARDVTMGIVFSRGDELDLTAISRLCLKINRRGRGVVGVSAQLSPNTVLILGQRKTVDRFHTEMSDVLGEHVHLRKNDHRWPPLHTPLLWDRNIPNRGAVMMHTLPLDGKAPRPPVFSLATGKTDYDGHNLREHFNRWIDHPQMLWAAVYKTLASGVDTVVHVGPEPILIPATFRRISDNVKAQLSGASPKSLGLRAVSTIWRPWLSKWLSSKSALLRAPNVEHVILEDWLLENPAEESAA